MKKTTLAGLISMLAFFLRTYVAYVGPIENDEVINATSAVKFNLAIRKGDWTQILRSTYNIEHPQFYKLVYAFGLMAVKPIPSTVFKDSGVDLQSGGYWDELLRMISVFFGTATVFLVSLINPIAGLFLAINTYAIKYTSVIYFEALPMFTSLAALMAALNTLKAYQNSSKNWKKWIGWLVISSLFLGMTAASKYMYSLVGIVIIISIIIQGWKYKSATLMGLMGWGLLAIAFFFLFDPILWHSPLSELIKSVNYHLNYSSGRWVTRVGYPFWQPIKWLMISIPQQHYVHRAFNITNGEYFILADSIIFILALLGLPDLFKRNRPMFIWLVVGLAFLLLWGSKWPQYILMVLVPFCISSAYGFQFIRMALIKLKSRRNDSSKSTPIG